jgi:peptidyl-prolyl cis-trans isomerase SurA
MTAALLALLALQASEPTPPGRTINRVAALLNGDVVTLREVQERAGPEWARAQAQPEGTAREKAKARALKAAFDALVAERLLDAQAKELALEVSDAEVEAVIADTKQRYRLDDATLDEALSREGMTRAAYRDRVRRDLTSYRVIQMRVRSRIKVGDDDLRNYYQQHAREFSTGEEIKVRHIFFLLPAGASGADEARAREKAERALARVRGGADFEAVAREVSQGPSASSGGDLGWLRRGVVQPELERAAFALQVGGVSDVVRTKTGFQIVKLEGRRGGEPRPFDQVKDEIRERLTNDQAETLRAQYVAELRKDALIEIRAPELKDP